MTKYIFKLLPTLFEAPKAIPYSEVQHKILNEGIEDIKICVIARDIREAKEKAEQELVSLIAYNFGGFPEIAFYKFALRIVEVEVLGSEANSLAEEQKTGVPGNRN